ncbi:MAG: PstA family ABC transporter permease [Phycisphaerales bacterium]
MNQFESSRPRSLKTRRTFDRSFAVLCMIAAAASVVVLGILLVAIVSQGYRHLDADFLTSSPSRNAEDAGIRPALSGTIWVCVIVAATAIPLGIGTAILLEEYRPRTRFFRRLHSLFEVNISNLAGVPSIIYGIVGLTAFVQMFSLFGNLNEPSFQVGVHYVDEFYDESGQVLVVPVEDADAPLTTLYDGLVAIDESGEEVIVDVFPADAETVPERSGAVRADERVDRYDEKSWCYLQFPIGRSVLAGGLTLMLVILPIVIISSQEAIRAVPDSLREGALGIGATRWQMIWGMTLPAAVPGIMTGTILAVSRAIGEAAPILVIAGIVYIRFTPQHLMDEFTVMPLQIYDWAGRPQKEFHEIAASGIIVLLAILLVFNAVAVFIRHKFQKPLS